MRRMATSNGDCRPNGSQRGAGMAQSAPSRVIPGMRRACVACRQMKMKCEGEAPCNRCRKVNRECIPQSLQQPVNTPGPHEHVPESQRPEGYYSWLFPGTNSLPANVPKVLSTSNGSPPKPHANTDYRFLPGAVPATHHQALPTDGHAIPSIYSTPPIEAVIEPSDSHSSQSNPATSRKRKRQIAHSSTDLALTPKSHVDEPCPMAKKDMVEMVKLFCQRHLHVFSVFTLEDFEDPERLIEHDLALVHCICYVTARYLPGGKDIREKLLPEVIKVPKSVFTGQSGGQQADELSTLKALIILHTYADLTPPSQSSDPAAGSEILFWYLKSIIEVYAVRLGLHRSIQDLKADLRARPENVTHTRSYQKYIYWLYLFSGEHYVSIVSGTPPAIRIDSSIRAAPEILQLVGEKCHIPNLFGQIELNLIWEKASSQHYRLGEWWCLPDTMEEAIDENSTEAVLKETDREIDAWYDKWSQYMESCEQGAFLDYAGRFTRFCITSYAIKCLRTSPQGLTPLQKDQVRRCVSCANHVLKWMLSRSPIQKDRLRYVDDTACIMVAFCCLFILSVCQTFTSSIPNISDNLDNVIEAAQLMIDLAFNREHMAHIQGKFILKRAESLRVVLENLRAERPRSRLGTPPERSVDVVPETDVFEGFDQMFNEEGFFGMEPIWDFSLLFPSV